ncbi:MAG: hypothetical protein GXO70_07295, partial [Acidobacteria bacterium]|nr:hypothetical protein [Acidobacteriota bacterium]
MYRKFRLIVISLLLIISIPSLAFQTLDKWGKGMFLDVQIKDNIAYCANGQSGLVVVDMTNPEDPSRLAELPLGGEADKIKVFGDLAIVRLKNRCSLAIVDISNPHYPVRLAMVSDGRHFVDDYFLAFDVFDNFIAACTPRIFVLFDISHPASPKLMCRIASDQMSEIPPINFSSVCFDDRGDIFVSSDWYLFSFLLNDPEALEIAGMCDIYEWVVSDSDDISTLVPVGNTLLLLADQLVSIDI